MPDFHRQKLRALAAALTLPIKARERPVVEVVGPAAGYTHRWAVNIDSWEPEGGAEGHTADQVVI